jgi:hypothetical protein
MQEMRFGPRLLGQAELRRIGDGDGEAGSFPVSPRRLRGWSPGTRSQLTTAGISIASPVCECAGRTSDPPGRHERGLHPDYRGVVSWPSQRPDLGLFSGIRGGSLWRDSLRPRDENL